MVPATALVMGAAFKRYCMVHGIAMFTVGMLVYMSTVLIRRHQESVHPCQVPQGPSNPDCRSLTNQHLGVLRNNF